MVLGAFLHPYGMLYQIPRVICWGLWNERNSRIFEDKFHSMDEIIIHIYKSLFEWASNWESYEDGEWEAIWNKE